MRNYSNRQKAVSITISFITFVSAVIGVILSATGGKEAFMGGSTVFMYFTIQSNIFVALIEAIGVAFILKNRGNIVWDIFRFVGAVSITLTGTVFSFVLAPTMGVNAWIIQNVLTHVLVPILAVINFFIASTGSTIKCSHTVYVIIPPLLYAIYAGIGFKLNWQFSTGVNYPYFFLNWGSPLGAFGFGKELPFMGCMWWIILLLIFLILIGLLYILILKFISKKLSK